MKRWFLRLAVLTFLWSASASAETVGLHGDPSRLRITGPTDIRPEQLLAALSDDPDYQRAARPSASLAVFLRTIEHRLTTGYHSAGYPDVEVSAAVDPSVDRVAVEITEGPRILCAAAHVVGAQHIDAAALVASLASPPNCRWRYLRMNSETTRPEIDLPTGFWKQGEPLRGDERDIDELKRSIQFACTGQGFPWAQFDIDLRYRREIGVAELTIRFLDEGPPANISRVHVIGMSRHTEEEIVRFLELPGDVRVTGSLLNRVERQLKESGRFWNVNLYAVIADELDKTQRNGSAALLQICVSEYTKFPHLSEPLSDVERAALNTAVFLSRVADSPPSMRDLVVEFQSGAEASTKVAKLIFGEHDDWILSVHAPLFLRDDPNWLLQFDTDTARPPDVLLDHTVYRQNKQCLVASKAGNRVLQFATSSKSRFEVASHAQRPDADGFHAMVTASFQLTSPAQHDRTITCDIEPVTVLDLLLKDMTTLWEKDRLVFSHMDASIVVKFDKDQPISVSFEYQSEAYGNATLALSRRPGAFAAARGELLSQTNGMAVYSLGSTGPSYRLQFVEQELLGQPWVQRTPAVADAIQGLIQSLADGESATPLLTHHGDVATVFPIPDSLDESEVVFSKLSFVDSWFPRGSGFWTVAREVNFAEKRVANAPEVDAEIQRFVNDDTTGPLQLYFAILCANRLKLSPLLQTELRETLRDRLTDEAFLRDVAVLTNKESVCGRLLCAWVEYVDQLSPQERDRLLQLLPERYRGGMGTMLARVLEGPSIEPGSNTATAMALMVWQYCLKPSFETAYNRYDAKSVVEPDRRKDATIDHHNRTRPWAP